MNDSRTTSVLPFVWSIALIGLATPARQVTA
jgi:hypothetical protein